MLIAALIALPILVVIVWMLIEAYRINTQYNDQTFAKGLATRAQQWIANAAKVPGHLEAAEKALKAATPDQYQNEVVEAEKHLRLAIGLLGLEVDNNGQGEPPRPKERLRLLRSQAAWCRKQLTKLADVQDRIKRAAVAMRRFEDALHEKHMAYGGSQVLADRHGRRQLAEAKRLCVEACELAGVATAKKKTPPSQPAKPAVPKGGGKALPKTPKK